MSNLTLKLSDGLLQRAKIAAVKENRSLSAWTADLIAERLSRSVDCREARRRSLARLDRGFSLKPGRMKRDELHER